MKPDFSIAETILESAVPAIAPAVQVSVYFKGYYAWHYETGWLDPSEKTQPVTANTRFDIASVTKLFASACFLRMVESGLASLDQPVSQVLPEFNGWRPILPYEDPLKPGAVVVVSKDNPSQVDPSSITFRDLLCHRSGLPAWRPLYLQPTAQSARQMAVSTFFSYAPHTQVLYSDIGLVILGMAIERITHQSLDTSIRTFVLEPLSLQNTGYIPLDQRTGADIAQCAPTEYCQWRKRRLLAEVHDENAWRLEGVSAHAGIFSTANDTAVFGQSFFGRPALLRMDTIQEMRKLQSEFNGTRRGLGFSLWSPDPEASGNPFSQNAFGHTGFTGTSLWMDPERELVVTLFTNDIYYGRTARNIASLRVKIHSAIVSTVDSV